MLLIATLLVPFILFIGGSILLHYPLSLGALYAVNVMLIYVVLWAVFNQAIRINSQIIKIEANMLVILRKQLYMSFPVVRVSDIEIPVADIREVLLVPTGVGYQLTIRFSSEDKMMGVDVDLNPLNLNNPRVINDLLKLQPGVVCDKSTKKILFEYNNKITAWKRNYVLSVAVIALALVTFLGISIYLGTRAILLGQG